MSAAEQIAALDATDPYPSFDLTAATVGCDPPLLKPGDRPLDLEYELVLYWPVVPLALQEHRS